MSGFSSRTLQFQQPWIDAFSDSNLALNTLPSCIALADLQDDADSKLIVGAFDETYTDAKLKIFKGTTEYGEVKLPGTPSAIQTFYSDLNKTKIPGIGVASGPNIYVYKNLRPYFKFTVPPQSEVNSLEADIWQQKCDATQLTKLLEDLKMELGFTNLSPASQKLLLLEPHLREQFVQTRGQLALGLRRKTTITCMTSIPKYSTDDEKSISCLVFATECAKLYFLDIQAFTILNEFSMPGIASHLAISGLYVVSYVVIFTTRNGCLYTMNEKKTECIASFSAPSIGLVLQGDFIMTALMDSTLHCFTIQGMKQWSVELPGIPITLASIPIMSLSLKLVAVSCRFRDEKTSHLFFYSGPQLMHSIATPQPVSAIIFGPYGQGESALITISTRGSLNIRLLKRTAQFGCGERAGILALPPPNSQIKLNVPKKSKLLVEQTLREREQKIEIYEQWKRSWLHLNVMACEEYLKALQSSAVSQNNSLKLTAQEN
nr:PREDICTED: Bardet-Biedl syndrome 1 protein [Bemisia tabaci]